MTPPGNWREKEAERGEVGGGVDGCDIRSHFDVALLLAAQRAVSLSLCRIRVSDLRLMAAMRFVVVVTFMFHLAVKSVFLPSFLPLSVARPSPIPILVWKHDEPHFHVERTDADGPATERTNGRLAAQFGSEIGSSPFCIDAAAAVPQSVPIFPPNIPTRRRRRRR